MRKDMCMQTIAMKYQIELVWNREFDFVPYGNPFDTVEAAAKFASDMADSGGGERVKKTRVVDEDGKVVWPASRRRAH